MVLTDDKLATFSNLKSVFSNTVVGKAQSVSFNNNLDKTSEPILVQYVVLKNGIIPTKSEP